MIRKQNFQTGKHTAVSMIPKACVLTDFHSFPLSSPLSYVRLKYSSERELHACRITVRMTTLYRPIRRIAHSSGLLCRPNGAYVGTLLRIQRADRFAKPSHKFQKSPQGCERVLAMSSHRAPTGLKPLHRTPIIISGSYGLSRTKHLRKVREK